MIIEEVLHTCHRGEKYDGRFVLAGTEPQFRPDRPFDTLHIRLDLDLDIKKKTLSGVCRTTLQAIAQGADTMVFDAVNMSITAVKVNGKKLKTDYDNKALKIFFPKPMKAGAKVDVDIHYRVVKPKMGMYFIGPDKAHPNKPYQVWTQGQDEYARYWFPCHDAPHERTTTEVLVRVPKGFTAISNGKLLQKSIKSGKAFFHWKQTIPHATYLVTLAVGEFSEIKDKWRHVPVSYYCEKGREDDAKRAFSKTPKMMEFFSKKIGVPYAYPKYAQVAALDFIYGGMENTSATTQTSWTLHDERAHLDYSSDFLVAHELAHQWFGDLLTCKDWSHGWLNESFATYFEALFTESDRGDKEFARELRMNANAYFDEDGSHYRRPIVTNVFKQPSDIFDRHLYEKGSLVLHLLRKTLGESDFWKSINLYVKTHREQVVETTDLLNAIEASTGKSMGRFFHQWIYRAGHPEYEIRYWWDAKKKEANLRVSQTQKVDQETSLFSIPMTFSFHSDKGERRFEKVIDQKTHLFKFPLTSEPKLVLFDPDHQVHLKKVSFPKPEAMWMYQLSNDPHVLGRSDAAKALGQIGSPAAIKALNHALHEEKFWGTQGDIATALGQIRTPEAVDALLKAHRYLTHPKARRLLIAALGNSDETEVRVRLKTTFRSEESYFAEVQALKSLGKTGDDSLIPLIKESLDQDSWNDILRCGAVESLTALKPANLIDQLKSYSRVGNSEMVRMTAVRCLAQVGTARGDVQSHLLSMIEDPYLLVQLGVVNALKKIGDERCVPALKKLMKGDRDGRLKRTAEEVVKKLEKKDG